MTKVRVVRLLRNGQITIPKEFREALGLQAEDAVSITLDRGVVGIQKLAIPDDDAGSPWLQELYEVFAPVRQSFADSGMSEAEINAELDAAVREARAEAKRERRSAS